MNNNIEEIKARLNIVDIIGEYIKLDKAGANWKGLCPFHHEKSPSFMVNEEKQIFHCFGCGKGGDMFTFVQEIESMDFKECLKILAEKAGVKLEDFKNEKFDERKRILEILELSSKFYETQLWKGQGKEKIINYLKKRGLSEKSIKIFRIGYAPNGWENILRFLKDRGFSVDEINKAGLLVKNDNKNSFYDRFRERIMFPVMDIMGSVTGYSARVSPGEDESQAKYINTPETSVYHKSKSLYGIYNAKNEIKKKNETLLVEGNMDVVSAHQIGIKNTVAVSGTALTQEQILILKRYSENILMLFDMDNAGQKAAEKSADICFKNGINVKIVKLVNGKDASEVVQNDPDFLIDAVKNAIPAMEYFLLNSLEKNNKNLAEGKKQIAKEITFHIAHISSDIEKIFWIKKIAQELDVEESIITDMLKNIVVDNREYKQQESIDSEELENTFQKRSDILRDSLIGLVISNQEVWKEFSQKKDELMGDDSFIDFIIKKGIENDYSFDNMLFNIADEKIREKINKIFFSAKYRFFEENIIENSLEELRILVQEHKKLYIKELQKEKLYDIIKKIKSAEQAGNKEALTKLMGEFTELSQKIQQ